MYIAEFAITSLDSDAKSGYWGWIYEGHTYEEAFVEGLRGATEELAEGEEIKNILIYKLENSEVHYLDGRKNLNNPLYRT